jgi:hypothetical protein
MNTEAAAARDAELKPILETMWGPPYREIAEELSNRNIPTPRGGDLWNAMTVMRAMKRLGIAGKTPNKRQPKGRYPDPPGGGKNFGKSSRSRQSQRRQDEHRSRCGS